jgi:hypothetical protein
VSLSYVSMILGYETACQPGTDNPFPRDALCDMAGILGGDDSQGIDLYAGVLYPCIIKDPGLHFDTRCSFLGSLRGSLLRGH